MDRKLKVFIAALLFGCLIDFPYGYYQFVRVVATAGFIYLGFINIKSSNNSLGLFYLGLAGLFQPVFKISFDREVWNLIDVAIAIILLVSLMFKKKN